MPRLAPSHLTLTIFKPSYGQQPVELSCVQRATFQQELQGSTSRTTSRSCERMIPTIPAEGSLIALRRPPQRERFGARAFLRRGSSGEARRMQCARPCRVLNRGSLRNLTTLIALLRLAQLFLAEFPSFTSLMIFPDPFLVNSTGSQKEANHVERPLGTDLG